MEIPWWFWRKIKLIYYKRLPKIQKQILYKKWESWRKTTSQITLRIPEIKKPGETFCPIQSVTGERNCLKINQKNKQSKTTYQLVDDFSLRTSFHAPTRASWFLEIFNAISQRTRIKLSKQNQNSKPEIQFSSAKSKNIGKSLHQDSGLSRLTPKFKIIKRQKIQKWTHINSLSNCTPVGLARTLDIAFLCRLWGQCVDTKELDCLY